MRVVRTVITCFAVWGLGCGGDEDKEPLPQDPAVFSDLFSASPYGVPKCDQHDGQLKHQREIRMYANGSLAVAPYSRSLQRYYSRHDLSFFTRFEPRKVSATYAVDTNKLSLKRAGRKALPGVDLDGPLTPAQDERLTEAVVNQMFSPMIRFAQQHGGEGTDMTNVVLLQKLIRPGDERALGTEGDVAGIAISPELIRQLSLENTKGAAIWAKVKLPANFTPMLFLHRELLDKIGNQDEVARDLVVAHEFGHTGGLVHVDATGNLMNPSISPGSYTCADGLNPKQIATLNATLAAAGEPPIVQALGTAAPEAPDPATKQHVNEIKALLRGDLKSLPSFLRPILHTRVAARQ